MYSTTTPFLPGGRAGGRLDQGGASPGVVEGLGRGFVRRKEDLVRGTEAGLEAAREVARRGLEAADNAAHVMGINRIPVLRTCLWGQVHTGFWNSYEVRCGVGVGLGCGGVGCDGMWRDLP